ANTEGGKVFVGMDDQGTVSGIPIDSETEQRYINEIKVATYPQLFPKTFVHEKDGKKALVFEINEYPVKPVAYKNRYYKRVKNSNHLLSLDEIVDLQQQSLQISYDAYPVVENLDSIDKELLDRFCEKVNIIGRINLLEEPFTNLTKLRLVTKENKLSLASLLLFGDHGYAIHIGRFKATDTIIDDLLLKDPLMRSLNESMIFIKKHINLSFHFDGSLERKEKWQYPLEAVRELLLNAAVQRDYKNTSDIVIKIFDDRIEFINPGTLYGNLTLEDLTRDDYVSSIRNKLLAESFYLMGDIEKYGTGFIRIRKFLEDYPEVTLKINEIGDYFKAVLTYSVSEKIRTGQVPDKYKASTGQVGFFKILSKP
ncbi:MAG: putative DNA binding domain-containing protein, partial [Desulfobacula sp.]|nr:putative DNA binding domain-containing protein [Desulfobacula sp.]